ncbi:GNAT family N-acetyltransferase [Gorillibacterium timonense]|uniref:GNAT family N-acetyltransferase n=1 Tax=Gorillibacterium timonense TaxID=1689269 RepID=UPI00071DB70B|nr:GNAT family N-acetyltransferase [Gorillibacterium timonense]
MFPLSFAHYEAVLNELKKLQMNTLFAQAVLEDKVPGRIYTDDNSSPSAFYIVHPYGMSFLFGRPEDASFVQSLGAYITNEKQQRKQAEWLQIDSPAWSEAVPELRDLSFGGVEEHVRVNFRFHEDRFRAGRAAVPDSGLPVLQLSREQAMGIPGTVIPSSFWRPEGLPSSAWIPSPTPDPDAAFGVIENGVIASVAFTSYLSDRELEIGIETAEGYKGRGLAYESSSALIEYCLRHDLEPVWGCREGNIGSYRLARKLGFEPIRTLPYYHLPA